LGKIENYLLPEVSQKLSKSLEETGDKPEGIPGHRGDHQVKCGEEWKLLGFHQIHMQWRSWETPLLHWFV
jgi:hypothetical protein